MIGILVTLLLSWILLRKTVGEPITVLGIVPNPRRLKECGVGLLFMAALAVTNFLGQAYFKKISYAVDPDFSLGQFVNGCFWVLKAVLFEELVFRGAVLYLLIRSIGLIKACLLSSLAFGVYHWYSYEVFGERLILMTYVLLVTGCGGWMFAFAFAKTQSMYAPTGLHFGWNVVTAMVFSSGPLGTQWLVPQEEPIEMGGWATLLFFSLQAMVAPGLVTWFLWRRGK